MILYGGISDYHVTEYPDHQQYPRTIVYTFIAVAIVDCLLKFFTYNNFVKIMCYTISINTLAMQSNDLEPARCP